MAARRHGREIVIRSARPEDFAAILEIWARDRGLPASVPDNRAALRRVPVTEPDYAVGGGWGQPGRLLLVDRQAAGHGCGPIVFSCAGFRAGSAVL